MSKQQQPETSLEAYKSLDVATLTDIYKKILGVLAVIGEGTFEDIAAQLRVDKSRVWKRMSELERMELVYRPGNKRVLKSGRQGYTWMLTNGATPKTTKTEQMLKGKGIEAHTRRISEISERSAVVQQNLFNLP